MLRIQPNPDAVVSLSVETQKPERGGHLLLIGGGFKPLEVLKRFVALSGGGEKPVVVFPMASEKSRPTGVELKKQLEEAGAKHVHVVHIDERRDALKPEVVEAVTRAGGVFFSGGDQNRISQRLVDTPVLNALRELMARGGVVAGTSAGAACQSEVMFVGEGDETVLRASNIVTTRGIGLLPGTIVDSHFMARKRQGRLVNLVAEHPELLGVGIDEATAAWVKPDGTLEVVGEGWVVLYDATMARVKRTADHRMSVSGLVQHVLMDGQCFNLQQRTLAEAEEELPLPAVSR
ncbi:cyanophycinase [Archangium gephyra]|uniref:Cyanophycinase n=1 Tax=Archangium gephyra TaxID=48 RepID=A0AAC8Q3Z6_9BACT|nr:cyanophycinase [Archangium gephyra]AKJ00099.1 Cyanophycinase [Archangium gephyra]REG33202.1 cyanophycinase [Archangium gephyra]